VIRLVIPVVAILFCAVTAKANPLEETRYCGSPKRDARGQIIRRADVIRAFRKIHPCPSTGLYTGSCPLWQLNHDISLACGGCDEVSNLSWRNVYIKTCAKPYCIDRFELKINQAPYQIAGTEKCKNEVVVLDIYQ
jgi:hypothetical protein